MPSPLMVACLVLGAASAKEPAASQNPHLATGMARVRALDESAALEALRRAQAWPQNTLHDLALIQLWSGLAHAGLSDGKRATEAFEAALRIDRSLALPEDASPRIREWWNQALERVGPNLQPSPPALVPPAPAPPVLTSPAPAQPPKALGNRRVLGTSLLAIGLSGLGAAALVAAQSRRLHDAAVAEPQIARAVQLQESAHTRAANANVLLLSGGGVLAGGLVLWGFELF